MDAMLQRLVDRLKDEGKTIALAESMTCGMVAYRISNCVGTSDVLKGSAVCYSPDAKKEMLNISQSMIEKYTCESPEVTRKMATNLVKVLDADIYIAITGLASPGGSESKEKPVGTVFICIYFRGHYHELRKRFRGSPDTIKRKTCREVFRFLDEVTK